MATVSNVRDTPAAEPDPILDRIVQIRRDMAEFNVKLQMLYRHLDLELQILQGHIRAERRGRLTQPNSSGLTDRQPCRCGGV